MQFFLIMLFSCNFCFFSNAQVKKQHSLQQIKLQKKESIIKTNNRDTLYFDIDNAIILTSKSNKKIEYYITATQGEIVKLSNSLYQLGNLTDSSVTVSVFEKATKKIIETKKFVVVKQILPF